MDAPPTVSRIARVALYGAGGLVAAFGLVWCANTAFFVSRATKTEGEIVRFEKVPTKGGWSIHPVFAYRDSSGHRWESTTDYSSATFAVGQKVAVIYDPDAPMSASLDSTRAIWFLPLFILAWGVMFLAF